MSGLVFVVAIVFMVVVVPMWLVLHYIVRWRSIRTLTRDDEQMLADLWRSAKRMEDRIATLETILDAEAPGWRARNN